VLGSPLVVALNAAASLHIIGGVVLGVALMRSKLAPRWLAIGATIAPVIHLASNLAGQLWLDSITWVVVAAAYAFVIPTLLNDGTPHQTAGGRDPLPA
jgi:membrane protein implicated in regulation of membrane protease activity